jgi:hypothetical protein
MGYTNNFLEHLAIKLLHTNNPALPNKTYSGKKPPTTWETEEIEVVTWCHQ